MVAAMGWLWLRLWLLPWDGYGCCYGWYHGMAMVAAMVGTMGLLWLLLANRRVSKMNLLKQALLIIQFEWLTEL